MTIHFLIRKDIIISAIMSDVLLGLFLFVPQYFFQDTVLIVTIVIGILCIAGGSALTYKKAHKFYKNEIFNWLEREKT